MRFDFFESVSGNRRILRITISVTLLLVILCALVAFIAQCTAAPKNPDNGGTEGSGTGTPSDSSLRYTTIPVSSSDVYSKGSLLVVNTSTAVRVYPEISQLVQVYGSNKSSSYSVSYSSFYLRSEALTAFNDMLDAYYALTGDNSVTVTSAYRTESDQASLGGTVAAGYSDHHLALSVALKSDDGNSSSALASDHWLYENCYRYGYVQRYPTGKEASTGISAYPNCLRYVGVAHATYMYENNLTLEEYIALLKSYTYEGTHLSVTAGSSVYEIYYVAASLSESEDAVTTLPVPSELPYTYSGNNTDGFIVTVEIS